MDARCKLSLGHVPLLNYARGHLCSVIAPSQTRRCCWLLSEPWTTMPNTPLLNQVSIWEVCDRGHGWKDPTSCSSQAGFWSLCEEKNTLKRNCTSEHHACQTHNEPSLFWKSREHHSGCEGGIPAPALPRTRSKIRPCPPNGDFSVWIVCLFYASSVLLEKKTIFKVNSVDYRAWNWKPQISSEWPPLRIQALPGPRHKLSVEHGSVMRV